MFQERPNLSAVSVMVGLIDKYSVYVTFNAISMKITLYLFYSSLLHHVSAPYPMNDVCVMIHSERDASAGCFIKIDHK